MSSSNSLSRTRSIREAATTARSNASTHEPIQGQNEAGSMSPSRLPTTTRTRSTTSSTTRSSATTTTMASRMGGVSGANPRPAPSVRGAPATTRPLARAPSTQKPTSTTATATAIGRAASVVRPSSSASSKATGTSKERTLGHSRAKSTVISLTSATTLRPLSHAPSTSHASETSKLSANRARNTTSPTASIISSTSSSTQPAPPHTSSSRQTRSQGLHLQKRVPSQPKPQSQAQRQPQTQTQTQTKTASSSNPTTLAPRRPAFNTNQQHYSPAKSLAPKPLTSMFLAPPSPSKQPANVALTAETSRLQTELLQLSLLHREAHATVASWHTSARERLGGRFVDLAAADEELRARERVGAELRGLQDLVRWGGSGTSTQTKTQTQTRNAQAAGMSSKEPLSLDEKIQVLDQVLNGLWILGEGGGRYQRTVQAFEAWAGRVAIILRAQRCNDIDVLLADGAGGIVTNKFYDNDHDDNENERADDNSAIFVSDLDTASWKGDHAGLTRMLEGWRRMLEQLGDVVSDPDSGTQRLQNEAEASGNQKKNSPPASGLARMLRGCSSLVHDMLAELGVMEEIERDALVVEERWMEETEARLRAEEAKLGSAASRLSKGTGSRMDDFPPWKSLVV